ncbi:MAG: UbiD family decarboxylase [Chloroflexi bacterium]|nr:UbiD family decarboxylase [Chloroflexota bacterium]
MGKDLRQFLETAKAAGPEFYLEVKKPLAIDYEINVLQQKLAQQGRNPVIYVPEMKGGRMPYVTNLFGSRELLGLAMGIPPATLKQWGREEVLKEFRKRVSQPMPVKWVPAAEAPVKQVIFKGEDIDLGIFPIPKHYPLDSGKYIVIGGCISKEPDGGISNVGVYRHEVKGKAKLGCYIVPTNHGAYVARRRAELGLPMEVVISIGHHPAVVMGYCHTGALEMNELEIAGCLLGEPLRVTRAETVDIPVPADAEITIEGIIDPKQQSTDGPFGEFTGYYGLSTKDCYIIDVTCITMRKEPIYHGLDPHHAEHRLAGILNLESGLWDVIHRRIPTLKAVHYPVSGRMFTSYVSIHKRAEGEGMLAGLLAIGADRNGSLTIVVDDDVDIFNEEDVLWALATRVSFDKDVAVVPDMAAGVLNPRSHSESADEKGVSRGGVMAKTIIDATRPVNLPYPTRITPPPDLWQSMKLEDYF